MPAGSGALTGYADDKMAGQMALASIIIPTTGKSVAVRILLTLWYFTQFACLAIGLFYSSKWIIKHPKDDRRYGEAMCLVLFLLILFALATTGLVLNIRALARPKPAPTSALKTT
jgi:hypothetical protein